MEPTFAQPLQSVSSKPPTVCSFCHQPLLPTYYFCPNCGKQVNTPALSTSVGTQAWVYFFSIILPVICYVMITKWPGVKYSTSQDPKAKQIGYIAWTLLILSSIITIWLAIVWTQQAIQSSVNQVNQEISGY